MLTSPHQKLYTIPQRITKHGYFFLKKKEKSLKHNQARVHRENQVQSNSKTNKEENTWKEITMK